MELLFRSILFLAGCVHILPSLIAIFPHKISRTYGIKIPDANYELLIRHRAILFGIIGTLMIYSAVLRKHYELSTISGLVSMISFITLYRYIGKNINPELKKVMIIDLVATISLCIGFVLNSMKSLL